MLGTTGNAGIGIDGPLVGDFGDSATPVPAVPSGTHYPRQAASVDAWASWSAPKAAAARAAVDVDGTCVPLALRRGTPTNGAWSTTVTGVGTGCHRYFFRFVDTSGAVGTYPTTGSLGIGDATCADWDPSRPADCAGCDG